ncbi:MAG: M28 family peptidase, partial [Bacteroidales bacterium]
MKKKYTPFILIFLLCVTFWISWSYPFIKFRNDEIATGHMLKSIEKISHTPHSFRNPKERAMVRSYLTEQLQKQGAQVQLFSYDSIPTRTGDSVRITNIYARLDPKQVHDSTQYILFLAHYDSSGKTSALTPDSTYSFGAADDGYGLAVILETVRRLKQTHSEWRQGIKVLFTDLEEEHMAGMKKALERNPEIFDQVNFAINIEARGVKGPALLFETSPRNEKLMQLYRVASDTYSYSLTSAVYRVMPNYTDFACIRNQIPGLNFAVIDNLNYYHTEQDQFTNVSEKSLNHYLRQITPITRKYLTDPYFSAPDALQGKRDRIFFLFPPFGTLLFSITTWKIITYAIIFLFGFTLFLLRKNKYICRRSLLAKTGIVFSVTTGIIIAGTGIAYAITHLAGRVYNPILTLYVPFDGTITIG